MYFMKPYFNCQHVASDPFSILHQLSLHLQEFVFSWLALHQ